MICMTFCFFNDTPTTEIYTCVHTLSLHDALPIFDPARTGDLGGAAADHHLPRRGDLGCDAPARPLSPARAHRARTGDRSEEHTSELQSLMRISYAVFCLKKKTQIQNPTTKLCKYNLNKE